MITDKHFIDWEAAAFGNGYGTGEEHVMTALKGFLGQCGKSPHFNGATNYDYREIEAAIGQVATWLLINILDRRDIDLIEWGTSSRFGWLTEKGELIKAYTDSKTVEQLCDILASKTHGTIICTPDYCNCDPATPCNNPLFKK